MDGGLEMRTMREIALKELENVFHIELLGENKIINGLNLCNRKSEHDNVLSYITSKDYLENILHNSSVVAVIMNCEIYDTCKEEMKDRNISVLLSDKPEKLFYEVHDYLIDKNDFYEDYNFETQIGENCVIAESAIVEKGVIIGDHVCVGHNSVIRRGTIIEDDCQVGCNTTIGSEGFQILKIDGYNKRVRHVGGTLIRSGCVIGDNVTVCNTLFEGRTYIGKNVCIDNLCYIGHNGYVGDEAVITAGCILCGSCIIENGAWVGVNSSVLNRVIIGNNSKIGMGSVVTRDIPDGALAYGAPARCKIRDNK